MSNNTLFIGLGVMGYHMASHLAKQVTISVYNRTTSKSEAWLKESKGAQVKSLENLSQGFDFIITCIGNDQDLKEIYLSDNECSWGLPN